jgi:glycosyltransferase involved in cell wall biosynthesis
MRVLMFGWEFPPHISGGLGTACYEMTLALVHHGTEVIFVIPRMGGKARDSHVQLVSASQLAPSSPDDTAEAFLKRLDIRAVDSILRPYLTDTDYQHVLVETEARIASRLGAHSILESVGPYGRNLITEVARYSEAAEAIARREHFNVIHAHDWMTFLAAIRAKRVSGKPLVVHVHALESDRSGEKVNPDIFAIEKLGMEAADRVIAVSHYTRNLILEQYGIAPDKVVVVHNAVSRRHVGKTYHLAGRRPGKTVLFLGRITFQKGPDYFVEAAAKVLEKRPDVTFVMAGAGDMLPRLIERVGQLRIGRHFHFTGFLRGQDVERMYAMSDLYVMPSVSEPFGISPLEAMVYDVPVIVSRHAGVSEVLTHALKVDFWDVEDMAGKILAVLSYPALSREMLRNGRKELKAIRWDVAAERIIGVYNQLQV